MRHLLAFMFALAALAAPAQDKLAADSVRVIRNPKDIIVTNDGGGISVDVTDPNGTYFSYTSAEADPADNGWDLDLPFLRKTPTRFSISWLNEIYFGATLPVSDGGVYKTGIECGFPSFLAFRWRPAHWTSFSVGMGVTYMGLNVADGLHLDKIDGCLVALPNGENQKHVKSRIELQRFTMPLIWRLYTSQSFEFQLGVIPNFTFYSRAHTEYKIDDIKYVERFHHLPMRQFGVDLHLGLGFSKAIGAYVKYSPVSPLRNGCGPATKVISCGLVANF